MEYHLAETESKFADLIWEREPISSRELVQLCQKELSWKSTTTYTVLRRLCDRGLFQNEKSVITSRVSREAFYQKKSQQFVKESFSGSLPKFLMAFTGGKRLSKEQAEELRQMIEDYGNQDSQENQDRPR